VKPEKWVQPALTSGTTASQAFVACVAAAAEQIRANTAGLRMSRDPEYLHQLRVGLRRMRCTLRAFRRLVRRRRASAFEAELRSALGILGKARDWDEFSRSGVSPALRRAARGLHDRSLHDAKAAAGRKRFQSLSMRLLRWAETDPWRRGSDPEERIGSFGARSLKRLYADLSDCAQGIDWADAARRHRVRIRAKRLRYGLDCFAAAFTPEALRKFSNGLQDLQELLGKANDCAVQQALLRRLASHNAALPVSKPLSGLAARERLLSGQAADAWSRLKAQPRHWRRKAARARG